MRFLTIVVLLSAFTLSACASTPNKAPIENSYYGKASAGLVAVPKDDAAIIADILSKGWKEDANIIKLLKDNSASLELFRKATRETNGGSIWGDIFNLESSSKLRYFYNLSQLFKLLILEGMNREAKGLQKEAKEDYLAATGFIIHMSEQRSRLISSALTGAMFNFTDVFLTKSFPEDASYRKSLLGNLRKIKANQDFLSSAIKEEAEFAKKYARSFEEDAKKGISYETTLFQIGFIDDADKKQVQKFKDRSKELTALFDGAFFAEFYKLVDSHTDESTAMALLAAKENNIKRLETKWKDLRSSFKPTPLDYLLMSKDKAAAAGKNVKLVVADIMANMYVTMTVPNYSGLIGKYWEFNSKLDALINNMASSVKNN